MLNFWRKKVGLKEVSLKEFHLPAVTYQKFFSVRRADGKLIWYMLNFWRKKVGLKEVSLKEFHLPAITYQKNFFGTKS